MAFPKPFYRWRPHPWHGLEVGPDPPKVVSAFIEITPFDLMKYEVDKATGYLHVDRPQQTSSQPPALYGFIPRTYCGRRVGQLSPSAGKGDGDPLDIMIISERPITKAEVIVQARVVGGLQMVDAAEADDKIVAVLANDSFWDGVQDIGDLPEILVQRLNHYFSTYKPVRQGEKASYWIEKTYGRKQACQVIQAAIEDYSEEYGE